MMLMKLYGKCYVWFTDCLVVFFSNSEAANLVKNIPEMEKLLQKAKSDLETAVDSDSKLSEQVRSSIPKL